MTDNATNARDAGQPRIPCFASILDVRAEPQFAAAHAPLAANVPLEELPGRLHELPAKGSQVEVFDVEPSRLAKAIDLLAARGYLPRPAELSAETLSEHGLGHAVLWRPSPLLIEAIEHLQKIGCVPIFAKIGTHPIFGGKVLDVACGAGREAVWLALHGWAVDGVDVLPDALAMAAELARRHGIAVAEAGDGGHAADGAAGQPRRGAMLRTVQQDLKRRAELPAGQYGLVTVFRFWHRPAALAAAEAVAPGGWLVYETFHRLDERVGASGKAVGDGELAETFGQFEPLIARDAVRCAGRVFSQFVGRSRR